MESEPRPKKLLDQLRDTIRLKQQRMVAQGAASKCAEHLVNDLKCGSGSLLTLLVNPLSGMVELLEG